MSKLIKGNDELFNEVYSYYMLIMTRLIQEASNGTLSRSKFNNIMERGRYFRVDQHEDYVFGPKDSGKAYSRREIVSDILCQDGDDVLTPFEEPLIRPMTTLELQWLKAIMNDPRIKLFDIDWEGLADRLDDVEPLFDSRSFAVVGQYADGDNYEDPQYQEIFRTLMAAIRGDRKIRISYKTRRGKLIEDAVVSPRTLEYSEREDCFRVIVDEGKLTRNINLAGITSVEKLDEITDIPLEDKPKEKLVVELVDVNNTNLLERFLTDFSHYYKKVKEIDAEEGRYRIEISYREEDRTEILALHLLPFAYGVDIIEPQSIIDEVKERIRKQRELIP